MHIWYPSTLTVAISFKPNLAAVVLSILSPYWATFSLLVCPLPKLPWNWSMRDDVFLIQSYRSLCCILGITTSSNGVPKSFVDLWYLISQDGVAFIFLHIIPNRLYKCTLSRTSSNFFRCYPIYFGKKDNRLVISDHLFNLLFTFVSMLHVYARIKVYASALNSQFHEY